MVKSHCEIISLSNLHKFSKCTCRGGRAEKLSHPTLPPCCPPAEWGPSCLVPGGLSTQVASRVAPSCLPASQAWPSALLGIWGRSVVLPLPGHPSEAAWGLRTWTSHQPVLLQGSPGSGHVSPLRHPPAIGGSIRTGLCPSAWLPPGEARLRDAGEEEERAYWSQEAPLLLLPSQLHHSWKRTAPGPGSSTPYTWRTRCRPCPLPSRPQPSGLPAMQHGAKPHQVG